MRAGTREAGTEHPSLLLVGMMGVGKSSVGRALARELGMRFIDSDREIERGAGRTIPQLFEERGEAAFRRLESEVLQRLPPTGAVIALGGGAFATEHNRALLAVKGTSIWLDASVESLIERTSRSRERPLLAGLGSVERAARLRSLLSERRPAYALAKIHILTDGLSPGQVARRIAAQLQPSLAGERA